MIRISETQWRLLETAPLTENTVTRVQRVNKYSLEFCGGGAGGGGGLESRGCLFAFYVRNMTASLIKYRETLNC